MSLPKPNVVVALSDERSDQMSPAHIRGIICNPIYAGLPPFPQVISDEEWIAAAKKALELDGHEQFFVNMLHVLRETYKQEFSDEEADE